MATATIIDGKRFAARLRIGIAAHVAQLKATHGLTPGLAVVLVGEDPASQIYVRNKARQAQEAGLASFEYRLPATTTQPELLARIAELNQE
ncbi:MAG: tetrahydrofolate dehydrogenase/cyclohydrolase catalytic domain-containing protein, partial [Candidatus Competibacteraceae bacterium]